MANSVWKKVDATNMILGRLCSQIAKRALLGDHFVIINAKDVVISGNREFVLNKYIDLMDVRTRTNPTHGPFHNSRPDTFLRQRIRFMLPKNERGKKALEKIHVFINDIPKSKETRYGKTEDVEIKKASSDRISRNFVSVADICRHIGWSGNSRQFVPM